MVCVVMERDDVGVHAVAVWSWGEALFRFVWWNSNRQRWTLSPVSIVVITHVYILQFHISTDCSEYRISRNIDSDFNLVIWRLHKDRQINLRHYWSIYTTSMGFSTYSTQKCQFIILPTAFLSQPPNIMFANNSAYTVYFYNLMIHFSID